MAKTLKKNIFKTQIPFPAAFSPQRSCTLKLSDCEMQNSPKLQVYRKCMVTGKENLEINNETWPVRNLCMQV